ncbi:hypothetical protein SAMN05660330_04074 [Desulforhopalus singaporensis]|uniref:Uncharacterized protein n=2 Tax=Desulforhopalus singaporensis TaxID=91360 RepID=A0A1H0VIE0_9BACT|nr:hypothetical protein SAMN05660330_04074 [Desulforhopalus singaporensis]
MAKKACNRIAYSFNWIALQAQKAWMWISGGDTNAVQQEIDMAKEIYDELYSDIGK